MMKVPAPTAVSSHSGIFYTVFPRAPPCIVQFLLRYSENLVKAKGGILSHILENGEVLVYQPQGRYVITAALLLGYIFAWGTDNTALSIRESGEKEAAALPLAAALTVIWLLLFAWACFGTMSQMLR